MAGSRRVVVQFSRKKQEKQKMVDFWWGDACMPADCRPLRLLLLLLLLFKISCHVHCVFAASLNTTGVSAPHLLDNGLQRSSLLHELG
jgi:hypothetical protein